MSQINSTDKEAVAIETHSQCKLINDEPIWKYGKVIAYWLHHKETRELSGERDNATINARCTQTKKNTHCLDGQHRDTDRTPRGRVNHNDRGQR